MSLVSHLSCSCKNISFVSQARKRVNRTSKNYSCNSEPTKVNMSVSHSMDFVDNKSNILSSSFYTSSPFSSSSSLCIENESHDNSTANIEVPCFSNSNLNLDQKNAIKRNQDVLNFSSTRKILCETKRNSLSHKMPIMSSNKSINNYSCNCFKNNNDLNTNVVNSQNNSNNCYMTTKLASRRDITKLEADHPAVFVNSLPIFKFGQSSISISVPDRVTMKKEEENVFDLCCLECKTRLRVFLSGKRGFAQKMFSKSVDEGFEDQKNENMTHCNGSDSVVVEYFPLQLRKYVIGFQRKTTTADSEIQNETDSDNSEFLSSDDGCDDTTGRHNLEIIGSYQFSPLGSFDSFDSFF